ncbi:MAG: hypothetical protein H8Z69_04425 [Nanohaloarchaea archaeon]|nr:hypothetical protein [Candidatus Nanohaloarchaea archaeon]
MPMITKKMLKEEWRMHSKLFSGRSFAAFPLIILAISFSASYILTNFSSLGIGSLNWSIGVLGVFLGLSVVSIGFSSRDALKNVLGPVNFLVYSSRTLPVSEKRLLASFLLKDIIYYFSLFLAPLSIGLLLGSGIPSLYGVLLMLLGFPLGLFLAVLFTRFSLKLPIPGTSYKSRINPLAEKSVLDVSRSSGGLLKIVFSLGVLTGFYWFVVYYFPLAGLFLSNPVLSFSVLIGTVSLTVYNWINRFDSTEDYIYLPLNSQDLLKAKQDTFLLVSIPLTTIFLLLPLLYHPTSIEIVLLSLASSFCLQVYTVGMASYLTGLKPNSRLFDSKTFAKYILMNTGVALPLLGLSVVYSQRLTSLFLVGLGVSGLLGVSLGRLAERNQERTN